MLSNADGVAAPLKIGPHTIMQGDCLERLREIPDNSVDLILTDPPYSSGAGQEAATGGKKSMNRSVDGAAWFASDNLSAEGFLYFMREVGVQWRRVLKPGGHVLTFIDWRMAGHLFSALESAALKKNNLLVWDKTYIQMGRFFRNQHELILHLSKGTGLDPIRKNQGNVLGHKPVRTSDHPTAKPIPLLVDLLTTVCPEGGTVVDCFMGSGTTGVACARTGRNFIGIELDPTYYLTSAMRIAAEVGL